MDRQLHPGLLRCAALSALALLAAAPAAARPGDVLVADFSAAGGTGAVIRVDPAGPAQVTLASGGSFTDPAGIAVAADGALLVGDFGGFSAPGGTLLHVDPVTGAQAVIATGGSFQDPWGVAEAPDGRILIADPNANGGSGAVIAVERATGAQTVVSSGGVFADPMGIAVDPAGNVVVADQSAAGGGGAVVRIDPGTGAQVVVSSGGSFVDPSGIAVAPDGQLLVADQNPFGAARVFRVNPASGAQTVLSSGGALSAPRGLAVEPTGAIVVADQNGFGGSGGIVRVDPASGAQSVLSSGGAFSDPVGVAAVPNRAPAASFRPSTTEPLVGQVVEFDATSSTDDGGIVSHRWDLDGDGSFETDTGADPFATASYGVPGERTVGLRVSDGYGESATTVRAVRASQAPGPSPPVLEEPRGPVLGKSVDLVPVSGTIRVRLPGATSFMLLTEGDQIPVGSTVDVTAGRVRLYSTDGVGHRQSGLFYRGAFVIRQRRVRFAPAELVLTDVPRTGAVAARRRQRLSARELWAVSRGHFRTRGRFASATVRGTQWVTRDRPDGTLVRVRRGSVTVRDFVLRKDVKVRAGRSYFVARRLR